MLINIVNVEVLNNPASFDSPLQFEITFDCNAPGIPDELEWKVTYFGSAECKDNDQELDSVFVGPIAVGRSKFVLEAPPPDPSLVPISELLDTTAIMLTGHYHEQEFIRVGYYVNANLPYDLPLDEMSRPILPTTVDASSLNRTIVADKPRVTRFHIKWNNETDELLKIGNELLQDGNNEEMKENPDEEMADDMMDDGIEDEDEDEEDIEGEMEIDIE